jgi:hypothetical protein
VRSSESSKQMHANPRRSGGVQRCMRVSIAMLVAVSLLSSCNSGGESAGTAKSSPLVQIRPYVRGCDETVWGRLEHGYRAESTNIGPLTFVRMPRLATARREIRGGSKVYSTKVLVTVVKGHRALVIVPDEAADRLRLFYDPEQWGQRGRIPVTTGQTAVEFVACPEGEGGPGATQFNGGFLIGEVGCYPLDVSTDGAPLQRITVSFGAGRCPKG